MSLEKYLKKEGKYKGAVPKKGEKKKDSAEIVDDGDEGDEQIVSKKSVKSDIKAAKKKRPYMDGEC